MMRRLLLLALCGGLAACGGGVMKPQATVGTTQAAVGTTQATVGTTQARRKNQVTVTTTHARSCRTLSHSLAVTKVSHVSGTQAARSTFGPWAQHVVYAPGGGIFAAYMYRDDDVSGYASGYWRLARSTNRGRSFQTVYDGKQDGRVNHVDVEADATGNVYVLATTRASGSWRTFVYRFPANHYHSHSRTTLWNGSSKFSAVYNPARHAIDVLFWWFPTRKPNFYALNPNGTVARSVQLFSPSNEPHATPEYPNLQVGPNGMIFAGWTTVDNKLWKNGSGTQNYYDAHFLESSDGGQTWVGSIGRVSLPIAGDDTGPSFEIVNTRTPQEFIPRDSSSYKGNWNVLDSFAFNKGYLSFFYQGPIPQPHVSYAQLDWSTRSFTKRISPRWTIGDGQKLGGRRGWATGAFSQDRTFADRLFITTQGPAGSPGYHRVVTAYSDDGGTSWCTYAKSSWTTKSSTIHYLGASRFLANNGAVLGIFTKTTGSTSANVYFVRTSPIRGRHR